MVCVSEGQYKKSKAMLFIAANNKKLQKMWNNSKNKGSEL